MAGSRLSILAGPNDHYFPKRDCRRGSTQTPFPTVRGRIVQAAVKIVLVPIIRGRHAWTARFVFCPEQRVGRQAG